jgi:Bacteriophage tail sheath protein
MTVYLAPGVYVEEQDLGPKPIEGVSTSTAGFVGMTVRGPVKAVPTLVTSFLEFKRNFGGYLGDLHLDPAFQDFSYLPYAVDGFFANGGELLYIVRVAPKDATAAIAATWGGMVTRLKENNLIDTAEHKKMLKTTSLRGIEVGTKLQLRMIQEGITTDSAVLTITSIDTSGVITVDTDITAVFDSRYTTVFTDVKAIDPATGLLTALATPTTPRPDSFKINANSQGSWGNQILVQVSPESAARAEVDSFVSGANDDNKIRMKSTHGFYRNAWVEIDRGLGSAKRYLQVKSVDGTVLTLLGNKLTPDNVVAAAKTEADAATAADAAAKAAADAATAAAAAAKAAADAAPGDAAAKAVADAAAADATAKGKAADAAAKAAADAAAIAARTPTVISTCEFQLQVNYGDVSEPFGGLTLENIPGRYYVDQIRNNSKLISAEPLAPGTDTHPFLFPSGGDGLNLKFNTNGSDGTAPPTDGDFQGEDADPGQRTGIRALEDIEEISIIAAPGVTSQFVQDVLIEQCERLKYRFAILDPMPGTGDTPLSIQGIQNQRKNFDTKYAAFYYPRLMVYDPVTGKTISVPPSGHMAGIYARTDTERGVHKAPANVDIRNILDLEMKINKREQEVLNPKNINVLRDFTADGRGRRVWGARCITSDTQWKYVPVRRLFIFVEASLDRGTQWVVFEPNSYPLWARVTQSITNFLTSVWRDGALMGTKPEEAFFVKCDRSTMSQDDIDNGRLIVLVGIAAVKPAEFVIIRISQFTAGASGQ